MSKSCTFQKLHFLDLTYKDRDGIITWAATWENRIFAYAKTKTQISFAVTAKLISAYVFATRIVQSLSFLNTKFQASSHFLRLRSLICVGYGRKPRRPLFWRRGSHYDAGNTRTITVISYVPFLNIVKIHNNYDKMRADFLSSYMSRNMRKPTMWILTRSDTN